MPDVGVLNLEIHDNSEKAAQGLEALDDVLLRIRHAVSGALGLSKVATEVRRLAKAVDDTLDGSVISRINQLTEALSKLNGLGSINIKINGGSSIQTITDSIQKAQESMTGINTGFEDVAASAKNAQADIAAINTGIENVSGAMNRMSKQKLDFSQFDPSKLPFGALGAKLDEGSRQWQQYGAIVKDTFETVQQMGSKQLLENFNQAEAVKNTTVSVEELKAQAEELKIKWFEVSDACKAALSAWADASENRKTNPEKVESLLQTYHEIRAEVKRIGDEYQKVLSEISSRTQAAAENIKTDAKGAIEEIRVAYYKFKDEFRIYDPSSGKMMLATEEQQKELDKLNAALHNPETRQAILDNFVRPFERVTQVATEAKGATQEFAETAQAAMSAMPVASASQGGIPGFISPMSIDDAMAKIVALVDSMDSAKTAVAANALEIEKRIDELIQREEQMIGELAQEVSLGVVSEQEMLRRAIAIKQVHDAEGKLLDKLKEIQRNVEATGTLSASFKELKTEIKSLFEPLTKLGKQFMNIAKRMAMRAVIRMFVQGMKEGVENMYVWSKAMGTDFAPAMDRAATAILDLKNSLGAMASEALMAFLPVLEDITNAVIDVINFFNQLFAAINGKDTWMEYVRGSAGAKAFEDTTKAAKGTQKAIKDLLADWDELNIIQSENAGGGSGSGLTYDPKTNGTYRESPIGDLAKSLAKVVNFFGGIAGIAAGVAGIWLLKKGDAAFMKYYQDHWPKPEKPSGGATTQQEIKDAADKATNNVVNDAREKITNAVKENTEATQQLVKAEHEVQKLDVAKEIAQMTNDKLDGMAQLRLGNGQSYMGMTMEQFTAQNPLLAGNRVGLRIDAAKEVGSRMLPAKVDTINLMSGVDTISVDVAKAVETSANPSAATPVKATVPALDVVEDVLKGEDIDWDYTFGDGKDHHNPYGTYRKMPDYQPSYHPSYQIPEYHKNWDTTPINATAGALESSAKVLESTAAATIQAAVQTETATAGVTANLAAATEAVNESVPLLEETAQAVESTAQTASVLEEVASAAGGASGAGGDLQFGLIKAEPQLRFVEEDGVIYIFDPEEVKEYGSNNMDYNYMKVGGVGGFSLDPTKDLTRSEKLQGWKFSAETWAAQHAQQAMLALMAAQFVGQYGKGKKEQREAYSNFFGEEYDKLSGAKKELVHQGYSPETADAIVETSKEVLKSSLPGFLDWMPDFAEGAISAVEDALVDAGGAAEFVDNLGDAIDHAGGIVLNSVLFPESAQEETVKLLQNPLIESLIDTFQELFTPPVNPNFTTPGDGGVNTNEKSFFRVNPNMVLGATPQEFGYGMGYTPGGEADMATATERGTKAANETLEDNTSETNRLLRQLIANGLRINLTPNSTMGFFGARAAEAVDRVNG